VDVLDSTHKGNALPPDTDAALALVNAMPLPPSLIVRTGHGAQPWWLLPSPWRFADAAEHDAAASLVRDWQGQLRALAERRGWTLDPTHDLARILRLSGTCNHKGNPVVPVTADLPPDLLRYEVGQLRAALARASVPTPPAPLGRDDRELALEALAALSPARADDYGSGGGGWLDVGMALHDVAEDLLGDWDQWSRKSDKYEAGVCAAKWKTFTRGGGLTLGSLIYWAEQDGWTPPHHRNGTAGAPAAIRRLVSGGLAPEVEEYLAAAVLDVLRRRPRFRIAYRQVLTGEDEV
jgi:hypothetical protein